MPHKRVPMLHPNLAAVMSLHANSSSSNNNINNGVNTASSLCASVCVNTDGSLADLDIALVNVHTVCDSYENVQRYIESGTGSTATGRATATVDADADAVTVAAAPSPLAMTMQQLHRVAQLRRRYRADQGAWTMMTNPRAVEPRYACLLSLRLTITLPLARLL